jgi:formate dehydrogenase iron-sulfur subunit
MADKAILYDATRCQACRGCQAACKQWNENDEGEGIKTINTGSYENPPDLSPKTWIKMEFREMERDGRLKWLFNRRACMHCTDAACVRVCPNGTLYHNDLGFVVYNKDTCTGCGYCADFCPFDVPRLTRNALTGEAKMDKCIFCTGPGLDRISIGLEPACVKTCPPDALIYGERDQLVAEGRRRVEALKMRGNSNAYFYGDKELNGLHVLYVLEESAGISVDPGQHRLCLAKCFTAPGVSAGRADFSGSGA